MIAVFALLALFAVAPAAQAASVAPRLVRDNPNCESLGYTFLDKFEGSALPGPGGTETRGPLTVTRTGEGSIDWSSTVAVNAVIVKGGPDANVYDYPLDAFGDTGLVTPNGGGFGVSHVEFCTIPEIVVGKDPKASPIPAGSTAEFTITVTNAGGVELTDYVFTDADCNPGTIVQTGGDTDTTFGPGEVRTYTCSIATLPTDTGPVVNSNACASAMHGGRPVSDCDDATVLLTPPGTPPGTPGTPGAPGTPGTPGTPGGGVLPDSLASGVATLRGPSGCVTRTFRPRVSGRNIASVRFFVDGRLVRTFTGARAAYRIKVDPNRYGFGRHRVVARVTFAAASGTPARTLRLTFRRCLRRAIAPRFTG